MNIFIPWWAAALFPFGLSLGIVSVIPAPRDYDFMTPMLVLAVLGVGFALSLGIFIGHFF